MRRKTMTEANGSSTRGYEELPVPFGWFAVAMSDEIAPGELKSLKYFGQEFVVWRGESGELHAVDPYCPHLGAHLGGGEIVGEDLRCPFHHWSFNGEGGVTGIPYSKLIPPKLKRSCLTTWHVQETQGVVFAWYHPRKAAPKWEVASAAVVTDENWVMAERHEWIIKIHVQEITENGQDYAHFRAVHGTQGPPASEFKLDGWSRRNTVETQMVTPRGPMTGKIDALAVGPGQSFTRFTDVTDVYMLQQTTPIDSQTTHLRWQLYHPPGISDGKMRVNAARMRDLVKQVNQDIPIWERKRYNPSPLLVEGDGPILAYRKQYARFYQFDDPSEASVAA
jgi:phenylpropionate dioxygenase-like ring-hydroxylating dioxygenase large terminal subunit